jgi:hypothetical protein
LLFNAKRDGKRNKKSGNVAHNCYWQWSLRFPPPRNSTKCWKSFFWYLEMVGIGFLTGGFLYFASKISGLSVDVYGLLHWNKVSKPKPENLAARSFDWSNSSWKSCIWTVFYMQITCSVQNSNFWVKTSSISLLAEQKNDF